MVIWLSIETMSSLASSAGRITGKRWTRILIPLSVLYLVNFVDRNNISFAVIGGMNKDLHIGNADAGLASGVFYLGYLLLQIPSGMLAERFNGIGAWSKPQMIFMLGYAITAMGVLDLFFNFNVAS